MRTRCRYSLSSIKSSLSTANIETHNFIRSVEKSSCGSIPTLLVSSRHLSYNHVQGYQHHTQLSRAFAITGITFSLSTSFSRTKQKQQLWARNSTNAKEAWISSSLPKTSAKRNSAKHSNPEKNAYPRVPTSAASSSGVVSWSNITYPRKSFDSAARALRALRCRQYMSDQKRLNFEFIMRIGLTAV